jgi:hypothetical protein
MRLVLETFDRKVDKRALIGPANEAAAVATMVRREFPGFGLLYDMGQHGFARRGTDEALTVLKDHLIHVHVGNAVKVAGRLFASSSTSWQEAKFRL